MTAGLYLAYRLLPALELVAVAMLVALVVRTALKGLEKLGIGTLMSVLVLVAALAGFGALVTFVLVPRVMRGVRVLYVRLPEYVSSLEKLPRETGFIPDLSRLSDRLTENPSPKDKGTERDTERGDPHLKRE